MKAILPVAICAAFCSLVMLTSSSCAYDSVCPGEFPCDSVAIEPCDSNLVYFEDDVLPLLVANCAISGCHDAASAQDGVILTDYTNVVNTGDVRAGEPDKSELYEVLIDSDPDKRMPPSGPLLPNQIQLIKDWIEEGAKDLKCDPGGGSGGGGCDIIDVSYAQVVKPVLETNCISCHNSGSPSGGIQLNSVEAVRSAQNGNRFFGSINHELGFSSMPQGGAKLDRCTLDQIKSWIDDGMRDN